MSTTQQTPARRFLNGHAKPSTPISALVERLESFAPPPKPAELSRLEAELRAVRNERTLAQDEFTALCQQAHHAGATTGTRAEMAAAERRVQQLTDRVRALRQQIDTTAGPWRRHYARDIDERTQEARERFADLLDDLDGLVKGLAALSAHASANKVESPFILRNASEIVTYCRMLRRYLAADRRRS